MRILESEPIVRTSERLRQRIEERFPGSGLGEVAGEVIVVARDASERAMRMARPNPWLRGAGLGLSLLLLGLLSTVFLRAGLPHRWLPFAEMLPAIEAGANVLILVAAAIVFLVSIERRLRRRRVLAAIHELRSLAHVIDMHQLAKDPQSVIAAGPRTRSSPERSHTAFELWRYFDYCSELLSIVGKVAALYAQHFDDDVVLTAVTEIESLSTGLSRKIWQKIMIVQASGLLSSK